MAASTCDARSLGRHEFNAAHQLIELKLIPKVVKLSAEVRPRKLSEGRNGRLIVSPRRFSFSGELAEVADPAIYSYYCFPITRAVSGNAAQSGRSLGGRD
jgi:hypothetical protein